MKDNKTYYLVCYGMGSFDDYFRVEKFITEDELTAKNYVEKFNRILETYREHYSTLYDIYLDEGTDYSNHIQDRFYIIDEYGIAFYKEIEKR